MRGPAPEQPEPLAVPAKQGRWLHDDQSLTPVKPAGEPGQRDARGGGHAFRGELAFLIQRQLFPQEKVLGGEGGWGAEAEAQIVPDINQEHQ